MNIRWSPRARRAWRALEASTRQRIVDALTRLAATGHGDVERLKGEHPPTLRLRVGDYRVRFRIEGGEMLVLAVGHRREVYRR